MVILSTYLIALMLPFDLKSLKYLLLGPVRKFADPWFRGLNERIDVKCLACITCYLQELSGSETSSWLAASKKEGTSVLQPQEVEF